MNPELLEVRPTLRAYIGQIILSIGVIISALYLLIILPKNGIYIYQIIDIHNLWLKRQLISLLRYKLSYALIAKVLILNCLFFFGLLGYYILKVQMTTIKFTNKFMEISEGILFRVKDTIDMVVIRDQTEKRNILQIILGISKIEIVSKDPSRPFVQFILTKSESAKALNFLQLHSSRSFVDYQMTLDSKGYGRRRRRHPTQYVDETVLSDDKNDKEGESPDNQDNNEE